jgi:hypothetical protein
LPKETYDVKTIKHNPMKAKQVIINGVVVGIGFEVNGRNIPVLIDYQGGFSERYMADMILKLNN